MRRHGRANHQSHSYPSRLTEALSLCTSRERHTASMTVWQQMKKERKREEKTKQKNKQQHEKDRKYKPKGGPKEREKNHRSTEHNY